MDFRQFASEHGFSESVYPGAEKGPAQLRRLISYFSFAILFGLLGYGFHFFERIKDYSLPELDIYALQYLHEILLHYLKVCLVGLSVLFYTIMSAMIVLFVLGSIIYLVRVVKRQRNYERNVISNDFEAFSLRHQLLNALQVSKKRSIAKAKLRDSNSKDDIQAMADIEALTKLKKMRVFINTRQSLESSDIEKRYRVIIDIPFEDDAQEALEKYTKNLSASATHRTKGKVSFGVLTVSSERDAYMMQDVILVEDAYDFGEEKQFDEVKVESEYTFPLSLFVDKQAEIDSKKDAARGWAQRTARAVDSMLATKKEAAKRINIDCGAVNALFTYELSQTMDVKNFDQLAATFDNNFKTSGASVSVSEGNLLITLPLPEAYRIPINVPSMYREVFG